MDQGLHLLPLDRLLLVIQEHQRDLEDRAGLRHPGKKKFAKFKFFEDTFAVMR